MTGLIVLDAAIGVVFALAIYSLAATTIQEAVASFLNLRGKKLRKGIFRLVTAEIGGKLMREAPVKALHGPGIPLTRDAGDLGRLPSSIPPESFARALLQTLAREYDSLKQGNDPASSALAGLRAMVSGLELDDSLRQRLAGYIADADSAAGTLGTVPDALQRVRDRIGLLGLKAADAKRIDALIDGVAGGAASVSGSMTDALETLKSALGPAGLADEVKALATGAIDQVAASVDRAAAELVKTAEALEAEVAASFDTAMDRVVGWYVRQTKFLLFVIGLGLGVATNFDLIGYSGALVHDEDLRARMLVQAQAYEIATKPAPAAAPAEFDASLKALGDTALGEMQNIQGQFKGTGFALGWTCGEGEPLCRCIRDSVTLSGLLSWLLIGLACTLGGQFWFDALKKLLAAREAVAPPKADAAKAAETP